MGKYTSLIRKVRNKPPQERGSLAFVENNTYVKINTISKKKIPPSTAKLPSTATRLRPTTSTTLFDEAPLVQCMHRLRPEDCCVCNGYVRWLVEDEKRLQKAIANPERGRREFLEQE